MIIVHDTFAVIVVYDTAAVRNAQALRTCRRYLHQVQRSVFEGSRLFAVDGERARVVTG